MVRKKYVSDAVLWLAANVSDSANQNQTRWISRDRIRRAMNAGWHQISWIVDGDAPQVPHAEAERSGAG